MKAMMTAKIGFTLSLMSVTASAVNLISNGDFSQGDSSGYLIGFVQGAANAEYSTPPLMIVKTAEASYLQIVQTENEKTRFRPQNIEMIVSAGKHYKISVRIRGTGKIAMTCSGKKVTGGRFVDLTKGWVDLSPEWQLLTYVWTPAGKGPVSIMMQILGSADIDEWFFGEEIPDQTVG